MRQHFLSSLPESWGKALVGFALLLCITAGCTNPFAPRLAESGELPRPGDQTSIEGVFQNFRYAYIYRDTVIYSRLLSEDFTFTFRDYESGTDLTLTRQEDMSRTARLFSAVQKIDLNWTDAMTVTGDSTIRDISRGFNVAFTFAPNDVARVDGRVNMRLRRDSLSGIWQIQRWRDESNY